MEIINIELIDAKERVIALIERQKKDFQTDMFAEIEVSASKDHRYKSAHQSRLKDIEAFLDMIRSTDEISKKQIEIVKNADTISEMLMITDMNEPGNILYDSEDYVLSEILGVKVVVNTQRQ